MKVGDYVRTKDYQNIRSRIGKIIKQDEKYYYLDIDEDTQMVWEEDTVLISSSNIIDLIEIGDYVNGKQVIDFMLENGKRKGIIVDADIWGFDIDEIKSIVTYEQFESMKYKINESEVN